MRRLLFLLATATVAVCLANASPALGQDDDEDVPRYLPGLVAEYLGDDGTSFQRVEDVVARQWVGSDPRITAGLFSVNWVGRLHTKTAGAYRLSAYAQGRVEIKVNGQTVLDGAAKRPTWIEGEQVTLPFGRHELSIIFSGDSSSAQLALYWEGPRFSREPIGAQFLLHDAPKTTRDVTERGRELVRALRCAACHQIGGELPPLPAADLRGVAGAMHPSWLRGWLARESSDAADGASALRRMPQFQWEDGEVDAVVAALAPEPPSDKPLKADDKQRKAGRELVHRLGCLACHTLDGLGTSGLYGGGDLTRIAAKRPADFFSRWLQSPAKLNDDHRMPVFDLSSKERQQIAAHLSTRGKPAPSPTAKDEALRRRGRELLAGKGCAQCHRAEGTRRSEPPQRTQLTSDSQWRDSCLAAPTAKRPGYQLSEPDARAVRRYVSSLAATKPAEQASRDGARLMRENNCVACHQRNGHPGLAPKLEPIVQANPDWAPRLPAMRPPSLNSVGDKLHKQALAKTIARDAPRRRDWLDVRMPKFALETAELEAIVDHMIQEDRIPDDEQQFASQSADAHLRVAGRRLVTADGFGCTSCHAVGKVKPSQAPINAAGPDLAMLGQRIRRSWFDRWVRNPARIVPRMEMPSVQQPIHGVLEDDLPEQLGAVWHVLNLEGFVPPEPNPVRIVRSSNNRELNERASVITDVLHLGDEQVLVKPLLVGLPNRNNLLFDLESARVLGWWTGDTARQHTKGKTWLWRPGAPNLLGPPEDIPAEISLRDGDKWLAPKRRGQFVTEYDEIRFRDRGVLPDLKGVAFTYRLHFGDSPTLIHVKQTIQPNWKGEAGIFRALELSGPPGAVLRVQSPGEAVAEGRWKTAGGDRIALMRHSPDVVWDGESAQVTLKSDGTAELLFEWHPALPADQFVKPVLDRKPPEPLPMAVAPGFDTVRLPFEMEMMPTGLAWRDSGELIVTSLKGRVWQARDSDGDRLEDQIAVMADDVAAPFGAAAAGDAVDVITKYALLRLTDEDGDGRADRWQRLASGWGHTADYHDWAIGLPRDQQGRYYVATACQQDKRPLVAAKWRGVVLRLSPREPTKDDPARFSTEQLSGGHRFPIGIARNRQGNLFVTDNQGNYNPFNELNHVLPGKRYGFLNAVERKPDFKPPLTEPAVNIPHPWTRSVNGICFLESPDPRSPAFGPYEGHLVGCEYDTRRLIRISLEQVGGQIQGAAYPLTRPQEYEEPLLGPLCCRVSPSGDLYVGCIRDSGWGGSNNVGTLVRLRPKVNSLPAGIAEVRAAQDGLLLELHGEIDWTAAADTANYVISSYRRESTPAYGGADKDRRDEPVQAATIDRERRQVHLRLKPLRARHVYQVQVRSLARDGDDFFPAEAHYSLNVIPE